MLYSCTQRWKKQMEHWGALLTFGRIKRSFRTHGKEDRRQRGKNGTKRDTTYRIKSVSSWHRRKFHILIAEAGKAWFNCGLAVKAMQIETTHGMNTEHGTWGPGNVGNVQYWFESIKRHGYERIQTHEELTGNKAKDRVPKRSSIQAPHRRRHPRVCPVCRPERDRENLRQARSGGRRGGEE